MSSKKKSITKDMKNNPKEYIVDLNKTGQDLMDSYLDAIKILHSEMEEYVIKSGIQKARYYFILKKLEKKSIGHIVAVYTFLLELRNNEYKRVKVAFNHLPAHAWENYKTILRVHDMPEQIVLNEARKQLRAKWLQRPKEEMANENNISPDTTCSE